MVRSSVRESCRRARALAPAPSGSAPRSRDARGHVACCPDRDATGRTNMRGSIFATLLLASCATAGDPADDSKAGAGLGSDIDSTGTPQVGILAPVCAAGATTKGVDVSYFNGKIDWAKVKEIGRA